MKTSIKWLWRLFVGGLLFLILLLVLINYGVFGEMPKMSELQNPRASLSSEVYSSEGKLIGKYYLENREPVTYNEISKHVVDALVSTEDERFYSHSGIDAEAIGRAISGVLTMQNKGGASTLTQQLAKQLLSQGSKNFLQRMTEKLKEQIVAVKLESNLTKEEILTLYLNTVPFGENSWGIKVASKTFYNKQPKDLSVDEAAVLVGLLKANTKYNPRKYPAESMKRRNTVINKMLENGKLTASEAEKYKQKPIVLDFQKSTEVDDNIAPYFRQVVEQDVKEWCKQKGLNIYKDGLKIYTTLDTTLQGYAEKAVAKWAPVLSRGRGTWRWSKKQKYLEGLVKNSDRYLGLKDSGLKHDVIMKELNKKVKMKVFSWNSKLEKDTTMSPIDSIKYMRTFVQTGFMVMEPSTGEVKAWVGGINHKYFKYDHVNIKTKRQVGSTIKPLLYCLAVDNNISPCSPVSCAPVYFPGQGGAYNAGGTSFGTLPMQKALAYSVNNGTLFVLKQVGIQPFVNFARNCGIVSQLKPYPSIALGAFEISIIEMLRTYTMFPNYGINTKPVYITRIEDRNGNLLETFVPERKEVINEITAYKMIRMMQGTTSFGTAKALKPRFGISGEVAGKTGTTNDEADAWFIGYTPQLLGGVWVGCEDRFMGLGLGEGARAAMPIWGYFFQMLQNNKSSKYNNIKEFEEPISMQGMDICDTYDPTAAIRMRNTQNAFRTNDPEPVEGQDDGYVPSEGDNYNDADNNYIDPELLNERKNNKSIDYDQLQNDTAQ